MMNKAYCGSYAFLYSHRLRVYTIQNLCCVIDYTCHLTVARFCSRILLLSHYCGSGVLYMLGLRRLYIHVANIINFRLSLCYNSYTVILLDIPDIVTN